MEVGEDVGLARRGQQLGALVVAGLGEDIAGGGWLSPAVGGWLVLMAMWSEARWV